MAILKKGKLRGKLGGTVTYPLNGQEITRSIGTTNKPPTVPQLKVRERNTLVVKLLAPVKSYIEIGFALKAKNSKLSYYNIATSLNRLNKNLIVGEYPNREIDYTKAIFSQGTIPVNEQIQVEITAIGLKFSWDTPAILPAGMKASDHIMLIAYCPQKGGAFCELDGARRKDGMEEISLPRYHEKITVHTFAAFIASDCKSISDSMYTGTLLW